MCDRHGDYRVPDFAPDFSRFKPSRRRFLGGPAAALTFAVGPGLSGPAAAATGIRATHGTGFCNLTFLLAEAMQLAEDDGLTIDCVNTPTGLPPEKWSCLRYGFAPYGGCFDASEEVYG